MDAAVDTAAAAHLLLARLPEPKRTAALMLMDLPPDYAVCPIGGPCRDFCDDPDLCDEDHPIVGYLIAGALLQELLHGAASPTMVLEVLGHYNLIRPGLMETS